MKLTIEISDEEIYEIGKETLKKKIEEYLEFIKLEKDIKKLSKELKKIFSEEEYWQEVEKSRQEAWQEYKKGLELE
jgi:DNA repair photolyase